MCYFIIEIKKPKRIASTNLTSKWLTNQTWQTRHVRLDYVPPANITFLSEQTQQPDSSNFPHAVEANWENTRIVPLDYLHRWCREARRTTWSLWWYRLDVHLLEHRVSLFLASKLSSSNCPRLDVVESQLGKLSTEAAPVAADLSVASSFSATLATSEHMEEQVVARLPIVFPESHTRWR
jgi:hypothetical protein